MQARSLSASEVESAGTRLRQPGSTSSSSSRPEEETPGVSSRKTSASEALRAATGQFLDSHSKTSLSSGDSVSVGGAGSHGSEGGGGVVDTPTVKEEGDADSVFESVSGQDKASRSVRGVGVGGAGDNKAFMLIITSDDRLEISLTPGAVETLYQFKKVSQSV